MPRSLLPMALAASLACGGSSSSSAPDRFGATPGAWAFVDVAGTSCNDGSSTGFGVNLGSADDVLVFLDGGGACWDFATCFVAGTATPGPFGRAQMETRGRAFGGTFFDRGDAANPFRDWTYVFVPYCTGDLHAGDAVGSYTPGAGVAARTWVHHGRVNVRADVARLAAGLPAPRRLVVAGSSAGGFGTLFGHDAVRAAFPSAEASLVDDSGPPLEGDALVPDRRSRWRAAWNLDPLLDTLCAGCRDDFSKIVPAVVARHPQDRFALLSTTQDRVIRAFTLLPAPAFEAALRLTVHDRFDPLPQARTFLVAGDGHALLSNPRAYGAGGTSLTDWLEQMIGRDAAWRSVGP